MGLGEQGAKKKRAASGAARQRQGFSSAASIETGGASSCLTEFVNHQAVGLDREQANVEGSLHHALRDEEPDQPRESRGDPAERRLGGRRHIASSHTPVDRSTSRGRGGRPDLPRGRGGVISREDPSNYEF